MNNEIAILIVGSGENSQQFTVGEPMYLNYEVRDKKRRKIVVIRRVGRDGGERRGITLWEWYYEGYSENKLLFEVPVDKCIVIYKAALEVVSE